MSLTDLNTVRKGLVALSLEQTLLEIGGGKLLNEVLGILFEKYQSYLPNCYENPEYLIGACKELGESFSKEIRQSLRKRLEEFSYQGQIEYFLTRLSEIEYMQLPNSRVN